MPYNAQLTAAQLATVRAKTVGACTPTELRKVIAAIKKTAAGSKGSADGTGEDIINVILPNGFKP